MLLGADHLAVDDFSLLFSAIPREVRRPSVEANHGRRLDSDSRDAGRFSWAASFDPCHPSRIGSYGIFLGNNNTSVSWKGQMGKIICGALAGIPSLARLRKIYS